VVNKNRIIESREFYEDGSKVFSAKTHFAKSALLGPGGRQGQFSNELPGAPAFHGGPFRFRTTQKIHSQRVQARL